MSRVWPINLTMIVRILVFLTLLFGFGRASAGLDCAQTFGAMVSPYRELQRFSSNQCEQIKSTCQAFYTEIQKNGIDPKDVGLQCKAGGGMKDGDSNLDYVVGCAIGGYRFVTNLFVSTGTALGTGAAKWVMDKEQEAADNKICDKDLDRKKALFNIYNSNVPKLMKIPQPVETELVKSSCEDLKSLIARERVVRSEKAGGLITAKILSRNTNFTADEQEYRDYNQNKYNPSQKVDLLELGKRQVHELGIKLECYNREQASAILCESIAKVAIIVSGPASWAYRAAKLKNIAKISGVKNLGVDLVQASKLSNTERIIEAERLVGQGALSEAKKKAVIEAHEVAKDTGRGFGTYSPTDLREKNEILKKAGFSATERDLLMRNGITGVYGDVQKAKTYAAAARIEGDKLRLSGKLEEAKKKYRSAADSMEAYLKDPNIPKSDWDYAAASTLNKSSGRFDKAAEYYFQSRASITNLNQRVETLVTGLKQEKEHLRTAAFKSKGTPAAEAANAAYENHRKLIEEFLKLKNFNLTDSWKRDLLKD